MTRFEIRPTTNDDKEWILELIKERWHADFVVAHGIVYHPEHLSGFIAMHGKKNVGLITYFIQENDCEIVTLNSTHASRGIGTMLINAVRTVAEQKNCRRLWLVTTNDNLNALGFYQRRGFLLVTIRRNELERSRLLKPEIPLIGEHGIPLRDEIEIEMILNK